MGGQQQKEINQRTRNHIMGFTVSHKPAGFDFMMQNCDLPPPSKVFKGPDKTVMFSMNRVCNVSDKEEQDSKHNSTYAVENGDGEKDKIEVLKALQASQTRAREAEKKAAVLSKERDGLSIALLEDAMRLFAYQQQVRLLELQVLKMNSLWLKQQPPTCGCCAGLPEEAVGSTNDEDTTSVSWVLALIFSLGIGVATALAFRY